MVEKWEKAGVLAQWLGLIAILVAVFELRSTAESLEQQQDALELQNRMMQEEHDWNRRNAAQALLNDGRDMLRELRPRLIRDFPVLFADQQYDPSMNKDEARSLFFACSGSEAENQETGPLSCSARSTAADMMNFLEMIAIGHENNSVDQKMIEQSYDALIARFYNYYEPFVKVVRTERDEPNIWKPIEDYVERYMKRSSKAKDTRARTGT